MKMSVLLSYLWRFWRRKSTLLGMCLAVLVFVICAHITSTRHKDSNSNPSAGNSNYMNDVPLRHGTNKRLQQSSSSNVIEDNLPPMAVKFLPSRDKHIPKLKDDHQFHFQQQSDDLVSQELRKKVASRHRAVVDSHQQPQQQQQPFEINPIDESLHYGKGNVHVGVLENGDYGDNNQQPLPGPIYRGDHGQDDPDKPLYIPKQRLVHLDLKGAPPKLEYLVNMLNLFHKWGATGILIEYEEMFPFEGVLKDVAATNHYNRTDIQTILNTCHKLGLEVIPLVQTFGHMEFILKLGPFAHLRDSAEMPESICPCHDQAMPLIKAYIDQVMSLHEHHVKHIHIGCDEVYHLGECSQCVGQPRTSIFTAHVAKVAQYVRDRYKSIQSVIVWDDMLRNMMGPEMQPLQGLVTPMVWVYAQDVYRFMPSYNWDRLADVFDSAWTASAFKGADGPTCSAPSVDIRLANSVNWLDLMASEEAKFRSGAFEGIVLTGWSRYDHFAVLAELLPAGLPSLATSLLAVKHGYFNASLRVELYKALDCAEGSSRLYDEFVNLETDPQLWEKMSWCFFPGAAVFKLTHTLNSVQNEVEEYLDKVTNQQGWLSDYNVRHNYSSPFRVSEGLDEFGRVHFAVTALMKQAKQALSEVYDEYTVAEWIEQKIYPLYKDMEDLKIKAEKLRSKSLWPRRPFKPLQELQMFGIGLPTSTSTTKPKDYDDSGATVRPKRLVQQPDYYRHPPGS